MGSNLAKTAVQTGINGMKTIQQSDLEAFLGTDLTGKKQSERENT